MNDQWTDLMIDLETLGTNPDSPIVSLGAQFFNPFKKQLGPTFEMILDISEQIERGRKPSGSTLKWWLQQEDAAKKIFHEKAAPADVVLKTFVQWYKGINPKAFAWGNGATFDITLMEHIFRDYKIEYPWGYNKVMDLRTFKRFNAPEGSKVIAKAGVKHTALADATSQAMFVLENMK